MRTVRITCFENDDPVYRFAARHGVAGRTLRSEAELETALSDIPDESVVTFAGSDPLEHPAFPKLLQRAAARGLRLRLITDGYGLSKPVVVDFLERTGLEEVLVVIGSHDATTHARMNRSLARVGECIAGLTAAANSNLRTYAVIPLTALNTDPLEPFLAWLAQLPLTGCLVAVPDVDRVPSAARKHLLRYRGLADAMATVFDAARKQRREIGVLEQQVVPPCASAGRLDAYGDLFNQRIRHLAVRPDQGVRRIEACIPCELSSSCPGVSTVYVEEYGTEEFVPVTVEEANRWYTKPINRLEEVPYTRVASFQSQNTERRGLIRINGHCNMGCSFCFVDLAHPDVDEASLLAEIDRMQTSGVEHLVLSGGEPSLHPSLPKLVARAREIGIAEVELQTNGVKFGRLDYARRIVDAGLTTACVSLHSHDPDRSDAITKQAGAFAKTVQGIHNFMELGVWTRVSHVINRLNYREVPAFVQWLRQEFPDGMLDICFARAQEISSLSSPWVLPTFTEIKPHVRAALDFCLENNISFSGLIGQGGYPPCMLDGELRYYENALDQIHRDAGESRDFVKVPRCETCSFFEQCVGVRRAYVKRHGDEELQPF